MKKRLATLMAALILTGAVSGTAHAGFRDTVRELQAKNYQEAKQELMRSIPSDMAPDGLYERVGNLERMLAAHPFEPGNTRYLSDSLQKHIDVRETMSGLFSTLQSQSDLYTISPHVSAEALGSLMARTTAKSLASTHAFQQALAEGDPLRAAASSVYALDFKGLSKTYQSRNTGMVASMQRAFANYNTFWWNAEEVERIRQDEGLRALNRGYWLADFALGTIPLFRNNR